MPEAITIAKSLILCKNSSIEIAMVIPRPAGNDSLKAAAIAILNTILYFFYKGEINYVYLKLICIKTI